MTKKISVGSELLATALANKSDDRDSRMAEAADTFRQEMEALALRIRDLTLLQPPIDLLAYFWSQFLLGNFSSDDETRKDVINQLQFSLEYLHAVWSGHPLPDKLPPFDEEKAHTLIQTFKDLYHATIYYCMASSSGIKALEFGTASDEVEFQAKFAWAMIRGHRYQLLEKEFFQFVLKPHNEAFLAAYGVSADELAQAIQDVTDAMRKGFAEAAQVINQARRRVDDLRAKCGITFDQAIARLTAQDPNFTNIIRGAFEDLLQAGICKVTKHARLPERLLRDLAYLPGENQEFWADGEFRGTPMRTLPARIRPLIKLGNDYYATDAAFIRDSAYRSLQRGLSSRLPDYRETWNKRQKELIEGAIPNILKGQLEGAQCHLDVYYPDPDSGQWAETDLLITIEDILLVVEAKAGVTPMASPATSFTQHARAIKRLVIDAYHQADRFLRYLASQSRAPIYYRDNGQFTELRKIDLSSYRLVVPIGLTVESFSPFSSMCKGLPEIEPILGRFPFISLSVDDLFVLNRVLPTAGAFFHYLEVRQQVAGIQKAFLFDEMDHLGAYITRNRFDWDIKAQLREANFVTWDSFSDKIDEHFMSDDWAERPPPSQQLPSRLVAVLDALDKSGSAVRLRCDALIRNLGDESRRNLASTLDDLAKTLFQVPRRRFIFNGDVSVQFWVCRQGSPPEDEELRRRAQVACLAVRKLEIPVIILEFAPDLTVVSADAQVVRAPTILQLDYPELASEAKKEANRLPPLKS